MLIENENNGRKTKIIKASTAYLEACYVSEVGGLSTRLHSSENFCAHMQTYTNATAYMHVTTTV